MLEIKNWFYLYAMVFYILIVITLEACNPLCEHTNPFIVSLIKPSFL